MCEEGKVFESVLCCRQAISSFSKSQCCNGHKHSEIKSTVDWTVMIVLCISYSGLDSNDCIVYLSIVC